MVIDTSSINNGISSFSITGIVNSQAGFYIGLGIILILVVGFFSGILWLFIIRPRLFNVDIEKHLVEGNIPIETNVKGRLWRGRDGVNRMLVFQGVFARSKRLPEPDFKFFSTKMLGNHKTIRKIRYLVSASDIWTPLPAIELSYQKDASNENAFKINIPKSDLTLWNIQEKKGVRDMLAKEDWWSQNKGVIMYFAAWVFTFLIVYILAKELGSVLGQAQQAQSICREIQTQCQVTGSKLAGVIR